MANLKEVGSELRDAGAQAVQGAVQGVQAGVTEGVRHAAPGLEALARFGYASKGVVYGTIGGALAQGILAWIGFALSALVLAAVARAGR